LAAADERRWSIRKCWSLTSPPFSASDDSPWLPSDTNSSAIRQAKHKIKRNRRFTNNRRITGSDAIRGVIARLCKRRQKPLLVAPDWADVCSLAGALPASVCVNRGVPKHQLRVPLMERRTVRNRYARETGDELFSMKTICPHPFGIR
jgi:hypothetical protein